MRAAPMRAALDDALLRSGKPVLVNFFASWCAPCLSEHPLFMRLAEREGATIVGEAHDRRGNPLYVHALGQTFANLANQGIDGQPRGCS